MTHASLAQRQRGDVQVHGLTHRFGQGRPVLHDLDLTIRAGEFVALLGRSGSGKSTLLRMLAGLERPTRGQVVVPANKAVMFQESRLLPWMRVWQNVALATLPEGKADRSGAERLLGEVGLSHRTEAWPLTLSGGEAQRVALSRALMRDPDFIMLDEPFGALDALTRLQMQRLVLRLWSRHACSILLVTHDVDEALLLADRVLVLQEGRIHMDVPIDIPRPRHHADPDFEALRTTLLNALGVFGD
ncbi:sulfonate ABC transporter ATP-binding protein [Novacetimonas maltaceti]|uniref:Aliphatic sulfonates import ATP-binding protein SsuB n=1 Tax=Novacetimonas maltaceti TaxID=1203393 RepID=A0A2S3W0G5_9PROT|nr:ABC transporter ATP-binding protein [Novacetimonas maltaceti]POF62384.1 Aliphatic sulfonates import ATP-binding protein SsuB [Novacetimonas maltaceti]PYD59286.1 sulfonate ABC transporter ATP-binding protein [Novacetimonas maltaceti]